MAKLTSKNQLTIPQAAVDALGKPSHFRVQVHDGVLLLWPGRLVCEGMGDDAAKGRGGAVGSKGI